MTDRPDTQAPPAPSRRRELITFFILAFGIWPIVAVAVVAVVPAAASGVRRLAARFPEANAEAARRLIDGDG